uniref:Uncharacterized protein n=1 Tax=Panthera tigris altaica TaxID=74533 RepID=A0A8C9KAA8_PANTA
MAGAGPTMLLREENGCCSRRQSSSSAGVSAGSSAGIEGQPGSKMGGRKGELQLPAASGLDSFSAGEPRVLGLAMVPGHHIVSIEVQRESLAGPPYL